MRRSLSIVSAVAGIGLLSGAALANHVEPSQAKKMSFSLVNGFQFCASNCSDSGPTNTSTQSGNIPACTPAVPANFCVLSASGSGKLSMIVTGSSTAGTQDVKIAAVARGLTAGCEGQELCISFNLRATTDDCPEGSCTTAEDATSNGTAVQACCVVSGGACKIKSTLLTAAPGIYARGKNTGLQIRGCGLSSPSQQDILACGIVLP